ncbi:diguanylate cyclase domain-containing protein [Shewanella ulleungensis]|uniref:PDC sensor domain-containing protein n=1 Tax=Shewanella ulleungensis TaxID=2282699 RepID=UPI003D7A6CB8
MKLSFRYLLLIAMTLVSLIPICVLALWTSHNALDNEYRTVHDKHLLLAKNLSQALDRYSVDALSIFNHATDSVFKQQISSEFISLFKDIDVESVGEYNAQGQLVNVLFGPAQLQPLSLIEGDNVFDLSQLSSATFTDVHKLGVVNPTLYMIRKDKQQRIWLAVMNPAFIGLLQSAVKFGKKGHAAIVDSQGNVLAHPNKEWQASSKSLSKVSIVQQMMAGNTGVMEFYSPAVKQDMIAAYTVVPTTGWGVMIPQPLDELYARAESEINTILWVASLSFFACLLISWWMTGLITRPIAALTTQVCNLAEQPTQLSPMAKQRIETTEFVTLFDSFHCMSKQVINSQAELAQRVKDKTADLAQAQAEALHLANHDQVTGLANRMSIRYTIQQRIDAKQSFSLLFIDLDGFKKVNDTYGHGIGDSLLVSIGQQVAASLEFGDILARYGGDEFVLLLQNDNLCDTVNRKAKRVLELIKQPYNINGYQLHVSACIGIAKYDGVDTDTDSLIHRADVAMYQAKHAGKDQVMHAC